jgi:hypothetical protein
MQLQLMLGKYIQIKLDASLWFQAKEPSFSWSYTSVMEMPYWQNPSKIEPQRNYQEHFKSWSKH